jgi:hypothetical protein
VKQNPYKMGVYECVSEGLRMSANDGAADSVSAIQPFDIAQ